MKKNSILNKFFKCFEEYFGFLIFCQAFVKQMFDVPQQMRKTFQLGESSDFTPASAPEISNQYAVIKHSKVINNDFRTTASINMKESDFRVSDNPEPVAFPADFGSVNKRGACRDCFIFLRSNI